MTDVRSLFGEQASAYARFRPQYPQRLFDWLAAASKGRERALDVACGAGQASAPLLAHFDQVLACDSSAALLTTPAFPAQVQRFACHAEQLPLPDGCLDLMVVAQALHWFATPRFFAEVRRTLRHDGLFCAWCYSLPRVTPELDRLIDHLHGDILGPYWPEGRASVDSGYRDIHLPLPAIAAPDVEIRLQWTLEPLLGYLRTWSAVQNFRRRHARDPLEGIMIELAEAWGDPRQSRDLCWPLHLLAGRNR